MRRIPLVLAALVLLAGVLAIPPRLISRTAVSPDFVHFESAQVHPLAPPDLLQGALALLYELERA